MTVTLTRDQQKAADLFVDFILDPNQKEMILTGSGGCGKTFLIKYLAGLVDTKIKDTCAVLGLPRKYYYIEYTATTNKAATVLREKLGKGDTIHSVLGLKVQNDFRTGTTYLARTAAWDTHKYCLVFIDECSMIDQELYSYINEAYDNTCKIVYVGDKNQLVPVKSGLSPVFKNNLPIAELNEVVRFSGSKELLTLAEQLKDTVETGKFYPIQLKPGVIDLLNADEMENTISTIFSNPNNNSRIVAYTNDRVITYNQFIRHDIRHYKLPYEQNEKVIVNSPYIPEGKKLALYHTEDELTITKLNPVETNFVVKAQIDNIISIKGYLATVYCSDQINGQKSLFLPSDIVDVRNKIKFYGKCKAWNHYFTLKDRVIDVRPRDACTIHKIQGTTLDSVFIDLSDLSTCRNPDTVARLLYVACTRPKTRIYFYGNLSKKYGGIVK